MKKINFNISKSLKSLMFKSRNVLLLLSLTMIFSGCYDLVADIELPESDPKIVLHSFISPSDSLVMAVLTWSNPITGNQSHYEPEVIADAGVKIGEKGEYMHSMQYDSDLKIYFISNEIIQVEVGKHYVISAELPDGQFVSAECYVPGKNESLTINDIQIFESEMWGKSLQIEYSFNDPGGSEQYYYSSAYLDSRYFDYASLEWRYYSEKLWTVYGNSFIYTDGEAPRDFIIRAEGYFYEDQHPEVPYEDDRSVRVLLVQSDEHYYRYHKDLEDYYPDDFFSEPVHIYSNIEGGLGVFAGYNSYIVVQEVDF